MGKNIAIFASGTGSNAREIARFFAHREDVTVALIVASKSTAKVLDVARSFGIPTRVLNRKAFYETDDLAQELVALNIDLVVLAGFLWLVPNALLQAFPERIVNIHPALLPKYGGAGMYGRHVHEAVVNAGEPETGITIHYIDEVYDRGKIIFQARCAVNSSDTPEDVAAKVHRLEHAHFPSVIDQVLSSLPDR